MFWNGFYTRKDIFIQLQEFPTPPYRRCCSVTKCSDSGIADVLKALKMHYWDPSQWDKMCFEYHRVIFHWVKWVEILTYIRIYVRGCPHHCTQIDALFNRMHGPTLMRCLIGSTTKWLMSTIIIDCTQQRHWKLCFSRRQRRRRSHKGR